MKKYILLSFIVLISVTLIKCKKDSNQELNEINDNLQYYLNFTPDIIFNLNDSLLLDIDNNGVIDIIIKKDMGGIWIDEVNDSIRISIGRFIGSGTFNLDTISFNEIIDINQSWYNGLNLTAYQMEFIGIRKTSDQKNNYGWIKVNMNPFTVDQFYYRKDSNTIVRAGRIIWNTKRFLPSS